MASKGIYTAVAVAGIAVASGAAWWYQKLAGNNRLAETPGARSVAGGLSGPKPPTVEVGRVEIARLADNAQAVGSLRSRRGVVLRPEVSGRITQLNFTDGQRVRKGQLLVQFDDQLQLAQLQQSQAELSIAQANQKRNQELVSQNFISQRSLDESAANLQVAQAKVSLARATAARLKIVAPFDGIAGIRLVNVGDYLKDGADIVNIEDIEAIFVDFRLPERYQSRLARGQVTELDIDALPGRSYSARIQAIDPLIDSNGRSVGVRACIDNRQLLLRPGMFARVNTVFGVRENARLIPEEAIVPQGGGQFVVKLLDGPDGKTKITQRVEVKVGLRASGKVEILEGLVPGETVVTTGQQRLQRDGTAVTVVDLRSGNPVSPASGRGAFGASGGPALAANPAVAAPSVSASGGPAVAPAQNPCSVLAVEAPPSLARGRSGAGQLRRSVDPAAHGPA